MTRFKGSKSASVSRYWLTHYLGSTVNPRMNMEISICSLCGNTGIVDTTNSAFDAWGNNVGRKNWCVCPNGQAFRSKKGHSVEG